MTETYTYNAFGTLTYIQSLNEDGILAEADTALSRFLYAGEQYDEVANLYYLRARRYDTTVGRFTQEDTYLGDGRNLYVYVQNNPLKYVDPSGYCTKNTGYMGSTDYLGYYSMYDPSNPVKVNELGWFSHGDFENELIERVENSYGMRVWDAFDENSARATNDFAIGIFYELGYLVSFGFYQDPSSEEVYYQDAFQAGRDLVDFITVLPNLINMTASLSNQSTNTKAPASSTTLTTTSQNTGLIVMDQGLNVVTAPSFYPIESGSNSNGNYNWGNEATLEDHYERHGAGVGASSQDEYAKMANDFYNNKIEYQVKVDSKGVTRIYDSKNNLFGSYNADGTTRTFFAPTNGQTYFDGQPGSLIP